MKSQLNKIGIPGIAIAIFVGIMLFLSFYFFYSIGENRQAVEEQGFRELNQLGTALKVQDDLIRKMVSNYSGRIIHLVRERDTSKNKKTDLSKEQKNSKKKNPGRSRNKKLSLYLFEKSPVTKNIMISTQKNSLNSYDSLVYKVNDTIFCKISYGDFLSVFLRKDFV